MLKDIEGTTDKILLTFLPMCVGGGGGGDRLYILSSFQDTA